MKSFKNRKEEIKYLENFISKKDANFGITYGRRRVGKTALHLHTLSSTSFLYYMARKANNAKKFKEKCVEILPSASIISEDFESLFVYIKDKIDCVVIDEFPNLIEEDENFLHVFQAIVDTILQGSSLKLFILGSSISVMKSRVLSMSSPLYGRRSFSLHLKPLLFYQLLEFFPRLGLEELIEIYALTDGIPYYINHIEPPFWEWLSKELKFPLFLHDEGSFVLRYEFTNSGRYFSILEAIAFGNTRMNEIAQYTNIKVTSLPQYLKNLEEVEFVKREIPVTNKKTSKSGIYVLSDNFLQFWFRFIYPNIERLDQGTLSVDEIKKDYPPYMGKIFERVVKQFIIRFSSMLKMESFKNIGRWWWKEHEIDLIAFDPSSPKATLIECKWKNNVDAKTIVSKLIKKEDYVKYRGNFKEKTHDIMVFAKSFSSRITSFDKRRVMCIDLKDMESMIRNNLEQKDKS